MTRPDGATTGTPAAAGDPMDVTGPAGAAQDRLDAVLRALGPVVVAFSGGADSAYLAWRATTVLGRSRARCVTAVSPSLAEAELAHCRELAAAWGLRWEAVATDELADPRYLANGPDRCFHCKSALMAAVAPLATADGATVVLGVNTDDLGDHRPGQQAAAGAGARFPLVDAGFDKAAVRAWSRAAGLPTWDRPAAPCLASRVPYGTAVTLGTLRSVERAEAGLRALGLADVRVRHYGDLARVEVPPGDLARCVARREQVVAAVQAAGYRYVTLDLQGLRSGNLNDAAGIGRPPAVVPGAAGPSTGGAT